MDRFIELASEQTMYSNSHHKHGSVLVLRKHQTFTGYNHSISSKCSVTMHAEEHAINNFLDWCRIRRYSDSFIRRKLNRAVLVTIRMKNDTIKYSPPCHVCIELIKKYGIKKILYSATDLDEDRVDGVSYMMSKKARDIQEAYISSGYRSLSR